MATIQKRQRKDGAASYRAIVRVHGHPTIWKTFHRKLDAERWAQDVEADLHRGRWAPTTDSLRRTVAEAIDRYLDHTLPLSGIKDKSKATLRLQLRWWAEAIGKHRLAQLSAPLIVQWRDRLATDPKYGGPVSPATVNRYLAALSALLSIAVKEWRWLERSPMEGVGRMREPPGRVRCLTDEERARLLQACRASTNAGLYPLVVLALSTGARYGELAGLRWVDVDLKRGRAAFQETKNGDRRAVPIVGHALEVMQEWAKVRRIDCDLVIPDRVGREHTLRVAFYKAMEAAKLENFRFHDLRHTAASYLAMSGATVSELAEILGHKTLQMVKRYSHLTEQHTARIVERMNAGIFENQR